MSHGKRFILPFLKTTIVNWNPFRDRSKDNDDDSKLQIYWNSKTTNEIIEQADQLYHEKKYLQVYELLNRLKYQGNVEIMWRIARTLFNLSSQNTDDTLKKRMINEAYSILQDTAQLGNNQADYHKWSAIILEAKTNQNYLEIRLQTYPAIYQHLKRACELDPEDFTAHYMLGRWCFELSNMNWFQQLIATYYYGLKSISSYTEAYFYLLKAEEIQGKTFTPNIFFLGKTCIALGQFYRAKYYLNLVTQISDGPEKYVLQAKRLLSRLEKYDLGRDVLYYGDQFGFENS